eukprot:gene3435-13490_t
MSNALRKGSSRAAFSMPANKQRMQPVRVAELVRTTPNEVYDTFNLPVVDTPDSKVEQMPNGTYQLKEDQRKGINPFEKIVKEPHQAIIDDKLYLEMAADFEKYDAGGKEAQEDVDQRMKWIGFFHRRKKTYGRFMMRIKLPNGIHNVEQMRCLASFVAKHPNDGCADITTRQNWQLRGMMMEDVPHIMSALEACGLTSIQTGLDNVRNTVGSPIAGIDPFEILDTRPICKLIDRYITNDGKGNKEISNLPRKWNVCVVGTHDLYEHPHINDLAYMPAMKDGVMGFNVLVGGFFSATRCMEAIPMDAWVSQENIVALTHAILTAFRDFGARSSRQKARMMWLIEDMGMDKWRAEVTRRMPGGQLATAGDDLCDPKWERRSLFGIHPQKQAGLNYCGIHVPVGRVEAEDMYAMADLAEKYGDGDIRLTVEQNFIISGIADDKVEAFLKEPLLAKFSVSPGNIMSGLVTCTGSQFCSFSNIDTKNQSWKVAEHLESVFEFPTNVRMHWTGCPNTCGQIQVGDIGLLGCQVKNPNGPGKVPAVDIYVGGRIGADSHLAEVVQSGVRCDDQLIPALEAIVVEHFGAVRRASPLPNAMTWKTMKKMSHELVAEVVAAPATHACLDCGYSYSPEGGKKFEDEAADYTCPGCSAPKARFAAVAADAPAAALAPTATASGAPIALNPAKAVAFKLVEKTVLSHDTRKFKFALPTDKHVLGLPIGQHVMLSYKNTAGEVVSRPYTPTSSDDDVGVLELVIKVYPEGNMTQKLESLAVGDSLDFTGPTGRITYSGAGVFNVKDYATGTTTARPAAKSIGMICGGTGLTPMLQVATEMLKKKEDLTIHMLVANKTEADILLRDELAKMTVKHSNFKVWHTLDSAPQGWRQGSGFIDEAMLKTQMPAAAADTQILCCGPPGMIKFACLPNLEKLGFSEDNILVF